MSDDLGNDITEADFGEEDFADLEAADTPQQKQNAAPRKRQRVTSDMVSTRYQLKQFWKNAGPEMAGIILLFLALHFLLYSGFTAQSEQKRAGLSASIIQGKAAEYTQASANAPETYAHGISLPTALISFGGAGALHLFLLIVGAATLLLAYRTGHAIFAPETGIAFATFLLISPGFAFAGSGLHPELFATFYLFSALALLAQAYKKNSPLIFALSGIAALLAVYSDFYFFLYLPVFPLLVREKHRFDKGFLYFIGGFLVALIGMQLVTALILDRELFAGISSFVETARQQAALESWQNSWHELARLFYIFFIDTALLPWTLLSILAVGYTLRANRNTFPFMPMLTFVSIFALYSLMPVSLDPLQTLPKFKEAPRLLGPAFALLIGPFFAALTNRKTLRWLIVTMLALTLPFWLLA